MYNFFFFCFCFFCFCCLLFTGYKAPKVYGKREIFDARAADIWSLGIVLFMMIIGAPPFKRYILII